MSLDQISIKNSISVESIKDKITSNIKKLNQIEQAALATGLISAGIFLPDGLNNAYRYGGFRLLAEAFNVLESPMHCYGGNVLDLIKYGFTNATDGIFWRISGGISIVSGIASLAFTKILSHNNPLPVLSDILAESAIIFGGCSFVAVYSAGVDNVYRYVQPQLVSRIDVTKCALKIIKDGFLDATGGQKWRMFGYASVALGIAGLALRKYEHSKIEQVPSLDSSRCIEIKS
jgi:hypothetical protein